MAGWWRRWYGWGPKRNSLIYHQQRRLWSLEIGSIYVGLFMKDLSNQAAGGGFLQQLRRSATTRNGKKQHHYSECRSIKVFLKNYMHQQSSTYARTEQRGVHLMLKAVSANQQQELVVDRDLNSTAILFRLYVRHQPGGPAEKGILLRNLTRCHPASRQWSGLQR